jgi:hypothetical protein
LEKDGIFLRQKGCAEKDDIDIENTYFWEVKVE